MKRDDERIRRIQTLLETNNWDGLVCSLPINVLLLTGYWPVVGTSVAVALREDRIRLIVPEDELELAQKGWADQNISFHPGSLANLKPPAVAIRESLQKAVKSIAGRNARVGVETGEASEPSSYAAIHLYGDTLRLLLGEALPSATQDPADEGLAGLRSIKTASERTALRDSCKIVEHVFLKGASCLETGMTEVEAANTFKSAFGSALPSFPEVDRADGYIFCMSGPNAALACHAYARSRLRRITAGDLVLVHCNSYADGYWTDITRTYSMGEPGPRAASMRTAVFSARGAALAAIKPYASAREIDRAAREVMDQCGFGSNFKHSTGHGVGFGAIDANAQPRLHPFSPDTLQAGMVFNVEPAAYVDGFGGLRHCDMVAATESGVELLTKFHCQPQELILNDR